MVGNTPKTFERALTKIKHDLAGERYSHAHKGLEKLSAESKTEHRLKGFYFSQLYLRKGEYREAIKVIHTTQKNYSSHISLLTNLAHCYYQIQDFKKFKETLEELKKTFQSVKHQLSLTSLSRTSLSLGKFLEEEALVLEAYEVYTNSLKMISSVDHPEEYFQMMAQVLRVASTFGIPCDVEEYYQSLSRLKKKTPSLYLSFEIQHALLLSKITLLGPNHGLEFLEGFLRKKNIRRLDKQLMVYDFLEELILRSEIPCQKLDIVKMGGVPTSSFEKRLLSLYHSLLSQKELEAKELQNAESDNSPACFLRLLIIAMKVTSNADRTERLSRLFRFNLQSLGSSRSVKFWQSRLKIAVAQKKKSVSAPLKLSRINKKLYVGTEAISFQKQPLVFKLLLVFFKKQVVSMDDVVRDLWLADYNDSYYHRLRNLASRINALLIHHYPEGSFVSVTTESLRLAAPLQLID